MSSTTSPCADVPIVIRATTLTYVPRRLGVADMYVSERVVASAFRARAARARCEGMNHVRLNLNNLVLQAVHEAAAERLDALDAVDSSVGPVAFRLSTRLRRSGSMRSMQWILPSVLLPPPRLPTELRHPTTASAERIVAAQAPLPAPVLGTNAAQRSEPGWANP